MAESFGHPAAVPVRDAGVQTGRPFAVYGPIGRDALIGPLLAGTAYAPDRAVTIVSDALSAIDAALAAGIAHPGLTPRNVIVEGVTARVVEFGLPALLPAYTFPERAGIAPSAFVRAPESTPGEPATAAGQQYAAAALLFWLISGRPPFKGLSTDDLRTQHATTAPPYLTMTNPTVAAPLATAIDRALHKNPAERYPNIAAFVEAIRATTADAPSAASVGPANTARFRLPAILPIGTPAPVETAILPPDPASTTMLPPGPASTTMLPPEPAETAAVPFETVMVPAADAPAQPVLSEEPRRRRGWLLPLLLVAALLALVCGGLALAREPIAAVLTLPTATTAGVATAPARVTATPISARTATPTAPAGTSPTAAPTVRVGSDPAPLFAAASDCWERDWPCAIGNLEQVVAIDPNYPEAGGKLTVAYGAYGAALARGGDAAAGIAQLDKALARDANDAFARRERTLAGAFLDGSAAYNAGDWRTAAQQFETVIATDPAYPNGSGLAYASHVNEGRRLLTAGDRAGAGRECGRASEIIPEGVEAKECLAQVQPTPTATRPPATPVPGAPTATPRPAAPTATPQPSGDCWGVSVRGTTDSNNGYVQVRGMVRDKNGNGVGGVRVEVDSGGTVIGVTTAGDGSYNIDALSRAKYTVRIRPPSGSATSTIVDGSDTAGPPKRFLVDFVEGNC